MLDAAITMQCAWHAGSAAAYQDKGRPWYAAVLITACAVAAGLFARADTKNTNGRIYPKVSSSSVWQSAAALASL
jgi:hypothetical protein